MMREDELLAQTGRLEVRMLHEWIEMGLVSPGRDERGFVFDDLDVARVHLVCDLCFDMGAGQESLPIILSLIDKLHRTRHSLRALATAIEEQPETVRSTITTRARLVLYPASHE